MIRPYQLILLMYIFFNHACADSKHSKGLNNTDESHSVKEAKFTSPFDVKTSTGKSYHISLDRIGSSIMDISVSPQGFKNTNDVFQLKDSDPLDQVFVEDLDNNGFDELYLITRSAGSGSYATIFGWASNQDLSVTPIYIRQIEEKDLKQNGLFQGYMGHDSIFIANKKLFRKFPIYKDGDEQCCPTGGTRTLNYLLTKGEASWILEIYQKDSSN